MNRRLNELHLRRGRLLERIASQRSDLSRAARPIRETLEKADQVVTRVRHISDYLKQHPAIAGLGIGVLFALRSERLWSWTKRAFIAWRTWKIIRDRFMMFGLRTRW